MLRKKIQIGDKEVEFCASATIPRLYRIKFKKDIFKDLAKLEKSLDENKNNTDSLLQIEDLEVFENIAYIMAYHANPTIPNNIEDWLDEFDMFSIYEVLPQILELWGVNMLTDVNAKKNNQRLIEK